MIKILYKNFFRDCLIFFIIAIISSSIIIWVFQAVNYLDLIVEDGRDFMIYLKFALLNYPKIIAKLLPFVIFFSFFYTIIRYEANNELIIFWNIGINKFNFVNFFIKISLIFVLFQLFLTILIVPTFQELSRKLIRGSEITLGDSLFKPKKFNDTIKGLTIYIEEKEETNSFKNVYIKKKSKDNTFQITHAKKGQLVQKGNLQILELYDGETINEASDNISNFFFSKSDFNFSDNETGVFTVNKIQEMSSFDMIICLNNLYELDLKISKVIDELSSHNCSKNGLQNLYKELYKRIILPFYIPILILFSQFLIIKSKENKNYSKIKIIIFLLGFLTIIFSEASLKMIQKDFGDNLKIIFLPLILSCSTYFYFFYIFKFKFNKIDNF